ncbi:2719a65e-ad51-41a7-959b-6df0caacaf9d [Thermothielavioides terrestris]|uniref:2719a65e-ad51-41a7-959b-6df0caacaf9d n=1 Tax=Thermothielavioides terrestris TaxID=2587410 RepID=A0A3S4EYW1_9PEZI|nr:2719a65e-ad51-41a7-959b-6df0caacaf9d [Thermothielavioides terrestris]
MSARLDRHRAHPASAGWLAFLAGDGSHHHHRFGRRGEETSSVLGVQPHGTTRLDCTRQVGTGHRSAGQSAGLVVWVTVGHGVRVVLVGSVTMLVMTPVGDVVVVVVLEVVVVVVGGHGQCRVEVVVVVVDGMVGQGSAKVRKSMLHPW